jgi:hypothetical protein
VYARFLERIRRIEAVLARAEAAAHLKRLGRVPRKSRTLATAAVPGGRVVVKFIPDVPTR